jgi:hypothetical protein
VRNRLTLIIAALLILFSFVGYYFAYSKARNEVSVMAASRYLTPYVAVEEGDLIEKKVPASSVEKGVDLTPDEYRKNYLEAGVPLVPVLPVLSGQRIDVRAIASEPQSSFGVVLGDERVIAVATTLAGSALGTVRPGDVVDVESNGDSKASATYAKVICVAVKADECAGVVGASDVNLGAVKERGDDKIKLLLAVRKDQTIGLAGREVILSLNPFCKFDAGGYFVSTRPDPNQACEVPGDRRASAKAKGNRAAQAGQG